MWWSPLIIVSPDHVYLSKLFLVLQSCPPLDIKQQESESPCSSRHLPCSSGLWWEGMGDRLRLTGKGLCMTRVHHVPWRETFLSTIVGQLSHLSSVKLMQIKLMGLEWGDGWRGKRNTCQFFPKCLCPYPDCGKIEQGPAGQPCLFKLLTNLWVHVLSWFMKFLNFYYPWTFGTVKMKYETGTIIKRSLWDWMN